jgi:hypothetical protein
MEEKQADYVVNSIKDCVAYQLAQWPGFRHGFPEQKSTEKNLVVGIDRGINDSGVVRGKR